MFCKNCGKPIEEGMAFCSTCGTRVPQGEQEVQTQEPQVQEVQAQQPQEQQSNASNNVTAVEENPAPINEATVNFGDAVEVSKPAKKKRGKKAIFIPVIALILVISMVAAVFASPSAKNAFMKTILSSEDYYAYVIKENVEDYIEKASKSLDETKTYMKDGLTSTGSLTIEKGDGLDKLLELFVDDEMDEIKPVLDMFKKISMSYTGTSTEDAIAMNLGISANDVDFGSFEYVMNMKDKKFYFAVPEYNKEYLGVDMKEYMDDSYDEIDAAMSKILDIIPDEKTSKKIAERYITCVFKNLTSVDESKETISANGVSQKVTKLSLNIDGELMLSVAKAVLVELKDDEDIKGIVDKISEMTGEKIDYKKAIAEALEELSEVDAAEINEAMEVEVSLDIYVDGKGKIVGAGVNAGPVEVEAYEVVKGNKFGEAVKVGAGMGGIEFEGGGKEKGGKRTGEYAIEAMNMKIAEISIKDVDMKKLEKDLFSGSITIKLSDGLKSLAGMAGGGIPSEIFDLSLVMDGESESKDKGSASIALMYKDDLVAKIGMTAEIKKAEKIKEISKYIDAEDEDKVLEWAKDFDIGKLADKLRKLGLDGAIVDQMEEGFKSSIEFMENGDDFGVLGEDGGIAIEESKETVADGSEEATIAPETSEPVVETEITETPKNAEEATPEVEIETSSETEEAATPKNEIKDADEESVKVPSAA